MSQPNNIYFSEQNQGGNPLIHWLVRLGKLLKKLAFYFFIISNVWVLIYRFVPVPITPLMLIRCGEQLVKGKTLRLKYQWRGTDISRQLPRAVISSEDGKFGTHWGFDFDAMQRAWQRNQRGRHKRLLGGSTISQQTAKNVFLYPSRDYIRKGLEAYFTILIEIWWPKERIMAVYLNVIEMGDGIYGAEAASQKYFRHSAQQLTASEAALIAATLPNPRIYKASKPSRYLRNRQALILSRMRRVSWTWE